MPLSVAPTCCRLRRTMHCINTNTRSAMLNRQISATTRCSSRRNSGVSDKERPFNRPKPCSIRYALRYAATLHMLVDVGRHGDGDQSLNTMFGKDRGGGLVCRRVVGQARLALFAFIQ